MFKSKPTNEFQSWKWVSSLQKFDQRMEEKEQMQMDWSYPYQKGTGWLLFFPEQSCLAEVKSHLSVENRETHILI